MDYFFYIELKNIWKMVLKKKLFTNDRSVIITTLRHVFSEKIIITAVNNGARTVPTISRCKWEEIKIWKDH